ncbi:MAG TPA: DUF503 domain-containing protein [Ktedonobacterales bacterium]|nr:DUF503 domain-containing protein [Ktedonobacterales bacterium]
MYVGACQVTLRIPASQSLKDKRQVVKSLLARLRNEFSLAAAEVEHQDLRQLAVLGLACVSNDAAHADEIIEHAVRYIEDTRPDIEVTDVHIETLTVES